ncbi:MAG: hypothetical protein BA871_02395 [Desulfuromonadales bacterium C00003096]|jgi:hypothetical protein|nr:MAG: hypothetical protein BA871_02395 [Desulfuromonadales bacterium C00003096]
MRCSKCGRISFDYLENCSNCGQDLRKISAGLGGFAKPDTELMWFNMDSKADSIKTEPEIPIIEQEAENSIDLSEIDVSDLVDVSTTDTDVKEIDPSDLETVADDKGFQQALDQVLKDE